MAIFLSEAWVQEFRDKLNSDERYARVAKGWEADMKFIIEPGGPLAEKKSIYLDLWHGACRNAYLITDHASEPEAVFTLSAPYENIVRVIKGELDPMQAMLTRKLKVQGNMAYMLRNVPVVLDFVRCLRESTTTFEE